MKYKEEKDLLAQMQLLTDRLDQQDQKHAAEIRELKAQFLEVDEEEEKLKADCLEADLKAFHSRPKWERVSAYKNDEEYTQEWLEHWEDDPRLLKYRENRDGKSATETKPKSKPKSKPNTELTRKSKRIGDLQQEVKVLVEKGYPITDVEELTGIHYSTVARWIQKFGWDRNLPAGVIHPQTRLQGRRHIPSLDVHDTEHVQWQEYINEEKVIEWFLVNNVTDSVSEMWQIDVAVDYAGFVGLDKIQEDIEGKGQVNQFAHLSSRYYKKLRKVIVPLIKRGVINKTVGIRQSWVVYEDVKDEDGELVYDDNGFVMQDRELRSAKMNLLHLNLETIQ